MFPRYLRNSQYSWPTASLFLKQNVTVQNLKSFVDFLILVYLRFFVLDLYGVKSSTFFADMQRAIMKLMILI